MRKILICVIASVIVAGCTSAKKIPYFKGLDGSTAVDKIAKQHEARICSDDLLAITVSGLDPIAVAPFNLPIVAYTTPGSEFISTTPTFQPYLIDINGEVDFPVIGKIKLAGLTKSAAIAEIKERLKPYLKDPIITIQFMNYKVTVLGEVARPGSYTMSNERVTLLEALGLAGDMTVYGKRDNVLLIRENAGEKQFVRINLNSTDLLSSPFYYLQQNDVIYVEPNQTRVSAAASANVPLYLSAISTLASMITVIFAVK